jgi:hypothetical protein
MVITPVSFSKSSFSKSTPVSANQVSANQVSANQVSANQVSANRFQCVSSNFVSPLVPLNFIVPQFYSLRKMLPIQQQQKQQHRAT